MSPDTDKKFASRYYFHGSNSEAIRELQQIAKTNYRSSMSVMVEEILLSFLVSYKQSKVASQPGQPLRWRVVFD